MNWILDNLNLYQAMHSTEAYPISCASFLKGIPTLLDFTLTSQRRMDLSPEPE
jgi:hypothetical protein